MERADISILSDSMTYIRTHEADHVSPYLNYVLV